MDYVKADEKRKWWKYLNGPNTQSYIAVRDDGWKIVVSYYWNKIEIEKKLKDDERFIDQHPNMYYGFRNFAGTFNSSTHLYYQDKFCPFPIRGQSAEEILKEADGWMQELIEHIDDRYPFPDVEPACGQVWSFADGHVKMITHIFEGSPVDFPDEWPPKDAELIDGPGAPWAPIKN